MCLITYLSGPDTMTQFIKKLVEEEREKSIERLECIIVIITAILYIGAIFLIFFTPFLLLILVGRTL